MVKVASNRRGAVNVKLACHTVAKCGTVWRRVTVWQSRRAILTNCYRHFSPVSCSRNWYESLLSSAHMYKCASHRQQRAFSVESPVILTNYCQSQPSQVIIGTVTATWWSSSFHLHALGAAIIAATWPVTYFCQSSKGTECCLHHICNSDGQWEICQSTTSVHCGQTNPAVLYCAIFLTSNSWSLCCAAISICFFNGMPDAHFVEPSWLFGDSDVISNSFLIFSANQGCDLQWEGPPLRGESPTS